MLFHWHSSLKAASSRTFHTSKFFLRAASNASATFDEAELSAARKWLKDSGATKIPRSHGQISFSRSQGAGGQHVNTTDSKATLLYPLHSLLGHIPKLLHSPLRKSRYYVASSDSIRISASTQRKQQMNVEECWTRLGDMLKDLAKETIPGETSPEQREKVEKLQQADNAARLKFKKKHSDKKAARKGGGRSNPY